MNDPTLPERPTLRPQADSDPATLPLPASGERTIVRPSSSDFTVPPLSDGDFCSQEPDARAPLGFKIERELGRGAMGVVYLAWHMELRRPCALKMILAGVHAGSADMERFRTEAQAIARLQHPGIVQLFEFGEYDGKQFMALEYCSGGSLDRKLHATPLPAKESAHLVEALARAMHAAHEKNVIHRDLKPANILLAEDGTPKITDFGLARKIDEAGQTRSGAIMGTPSYMAPEQASGNNKEIGPACDIYALGAILYDLLTGRPPFKAAQALDTILQVMSDDPVPPRRLQSGTPADLNTICLKCLEKVPGKRYATALALADDLARFQAGQPVQARPIGNLERGWRWCRRNPALAGLTAAVLLLLVTVAVGSTLASFRLNTALNGSRQATEEARKATDEANASLWGAKLDQARASRMTRQPGQRFQSLRAIQDALKLPLPPHRSLDELRTEAIAALCLPDVEVAMEWEGLPTSWTSFAIDSAFERYAWGDTDGNVFVRRVCDNAELFRLSGNGPVQNYGGIVFSPDGRFVHQTCIVSQQNQCQLWRVDVPKPILVVTESHDGFAFQPYSQRCATCSADGTIRLYDLRSGHEGEEMGHFDSGLKSCGLTWNPKQDLLAAFSATAFRVIEVNSGKVSLQKSQANISGAEWHPDGNRLAVGNNGPFTRQISLWDIRTGLLACPPLRGHKTDGLLFRFNHRGDQLVSNDWSGMLRLWDVQTGRQLLASPASGYCLQFSPDDQLLAADVSSHKVRLFRCWASEEHKTMIDHYPPSSADDHSLSYAIVHPAGRLMAVQSAQGVMLMDLARNEEMTLLRMQPRNRPLRFDPADGSLCTYGTNGVLSWPLRIDADKPMQLHISTPVRLSNLAIEDMWGSSRDGQVVAIPYYAHGALLWQRSTNQYIPLTPQDDVRSCSVSPDGLWVATHTHGGTNTNTRAQIWDGRSGQHVANLDVGPLGKVGFSPDGKWLLTSGVTFRLWEVGTWNERRAFGDATSNNYFAFSADGTLLALGDAAQGVVRLVQPNTGKEVARLTGPEPTRLCPLCFSPDGTRLITMGTDSKELHLFDLRAIRKELLELGLDWDAPPLPDDVGVRPEAMQVEVDMGQPEEVGDWSR